MKTFQKFYVMTIVALLAIGCARNPVTGKKEFMLMSESQEISLGKESDPSIVAQYGLYENQALQNFINEKGKEMAAISHRPNLNYEFKILDSPIINAFAVPGGYVYFTRGIMGHFNNEAEFAGVLGHEIGHITAKHSAKQYSKQMLSQILFIGGVVFSEKFRNMADVAQQGLGLLFLKFSRDNESESDKLGVEYSTHVGYDAKQMAGFFKTLDRVSGGPEGRIPNFMSTHPDPGDRFVKVGLLADKAQANVDKSTLKVNRDNYLRMIDGLIYGEDPRQGFVESGYFYHPELKFFFSVPQDWQTANSPQQFQMAPKDGKALMLLTVASGKTLAEAKALVIEENKLRVIEESNTPVNGMSAISLLSEVVQEQAQNANAQPASTIRVLTYLIEYNNLIYKFHGMSESADFNTYYGTFSSTMRSFKKLTDSSKLNKKPITIKIIESPQSLSLQALLTRNNIPQSRHNEIAVLNSLELTDVIEQGTLIKILAGDL